MNYKISLIIHMVIVISLLGCATTSRNKILLGMLAGGIVGSAVGYATTPSGTDPAMHGTYWGLASATTMGVAGLFIFDEQKKSAELERQNAALKSEVDAYRSDARLDEQGITLEGENRFAKELPGALKGIVVPGRWRYMRFPKNKWTKVGKGGNTLQIQRVCEAAQITSPYFRFSPNSDNSESTGLDLTNGVGGAGLKDSQDLNINEIGAAFQKEAYQSVGKLTQAENKNKNEPKTKGGENGNL